ncbi:MAG: adenylyltransferase/cytidyltransferase family protein [Candidatus Hodarchaeales archaeon]
MKNDSSSPEIFQILLKKFLRAAYLLTLKNGSFDSETFSNKIMRTHEESKALISVLISMNMVERVHGSKDSYKVTVGGRNNLKLVLLGGVFDIVHLGHLETMKTAKKFGDMLLIVVASDETVKSSKGRAPINSQKNRAELLSHFNIVDIVHKGSPDPSKFLDVVIDYHADVIALGYDQGSMETRLYELLNERGLKDIEVIRLETKVPNEKSSLKLQNLDEKSFD